MVREHRIFLCILFFAAFLIFFRITWFDMDTDGAFYSLWSAGYFDYLFSDQQTTPVQWFDSVPWWGWLSFHAHPPLVFFIFHIFFRIFGDTIFVARLPVALSGLGTLALAYFMTWKMKNKRAAIFCAILLSLNTYFVWSSRITYLEGVEIFFIFLSTLLFIKFFEEKFWIYPFFFVLGLTLLTKYTALFLLPAFFAHSLIFWQYKRTRRKSSIPFFTYLFAFLLFFLVLSPPIIYNVMMYQTRGHFDVQITHFFPSTYQSAKKDWPILFNNVSEPPLSGPWKNFVSIWQTLRLSMSLPMAVFLALGVLGFIFFGYKYIGIEYYLLFLLSFFFLVDMFLFIQSHSRYLSILVPYAAVMSGIFFDSLVSKFAIFKRRYFLRNVFFFFAAALLLFELLYNVNTNHAKSAWGEKNTLYSEMRLERRGFIDLERYLVPLWSQDKEYQKRVKTPKSVKDYRIEWDDLKGRDLYLYDIGLYWFSATWHLQRHYLYHNVNLSSDYTLSKVLPIEKNWFEALSKAGVRNIYFIRGVSPGVQDAGYMRNNDKAKIADFVEKNIAQFLGTYSEVKEIFTPSGELAFRVYKMKLNL